MKRVLRLMLGAASALVIAGTLFLPSFGPGLEERPAAATLVSVNPVPLKLVCPGPFIEVAGESGTELGQIERIGEASIAQAGSGQIQLESPLVTSATELLAAGNEQSTALLSAVQTQLVERSRASGLAAAFCEQPTTSGWFVSGQTTVGAETVMMLANPNLVDTQVEIRYHLPGGITESRFALAAGEELLVNLSGEVGPNPIYAIEFESLGSAVSVALQHRYSRGLTPLGLSLSTSYQNPNEVSWIAPVSILAEGYQPPKLRLFAPGDRAEVIITAFSENDPELIRAVVQAQSFEEVELDLLPGTYALKVESESEVLAAVLNPSLEPLDYSWVYPAQQFTQLTLPIPNYQSRLSLFNPNPTAMTLNLRVATNSDEQLRSVQLPALSSLNIPVDGLSVELSSANQFLAALEITDPAGYAVIAPSENANPGRELSVLVR